MCENWEILTEGFDKTMTPYWTPYKIIGKKKILRSPELSMGQIQVHK